MKIAIISDIHENFHNLALFYKDIKQKNIEQIFCLWDLINAWIAKVLSLSKIPVFTVWWNNDWTKVAITKVSLQPWSFLTVSDEVFDVFEIWGKKFFLTHYPLLAKSISKSWDYDVVCFWHSHKESINKTDICISINPWSLGNFWTYSIYDTEKNSAEIIYLKDFIFTKTEFANNYHEEIWYERPNDKSRQS